jgi:hypothetical protein
MHFISLSVCYFPTEVARDKAFLPKLTIKSAHIAKSFIVIVLKGYRVNLDRKKAMAVLHEILTVIQDKITVSGAQLDGGQNGDCSIKLRFRLDESTRVELQPIIDRNQISVKQAEDYVIIE